MGFNIIKKLNTAKVTMYSVVFEPQLRDYNIALNGVLQLTLICLVSLHYTLAGCN